MNTARALLFPLMLTSAMACGLDPVPTLPEDEAEPEALAPSTRNDLQWKRALVLQRDLLRALELSEDELCKELGTFDCVKDVHLVSLGGHDAIESAIYNSLPGPLATTPVAVDRVVLAGCTHRVDADAAGDAKVFSELDLKSDAPAADDPAVESTITTLYRRMLARDPIEAEVEQLATLVVDEEGEPIAAADFAKLACYAIGTSTEFLFI